MGEIDTMHTQMISWTLHRLTRTGRARLDLIVVSWNTLVFPASGHERRIGDTGWISGPNRILLR